jgi:hypothetical protein
MVDEYPQHEIAKRHEAAIDVVSAFLDWLEEKRIHLARYAGNKLQEDYTSKTELIAQFVGINLKEYDDEKKRLLEEIRRGVGGKNEED